MNTWQYCVDTKSGHHILVNQKFKFVNDDTHQKLCPSSNNDNCNDWRKVSLYEKEKKIKYLSVNFISSYKMGKWFVHFYIQ